MIRSWEQIIVLKRSRRGMIADNSILEDQGCQKKIKAGNDRIMGADNRFEKIKVADDQIKAARKRSRRGMIRSRLPEKDRDRL